MKKNPSVTQSERVYSDQERIVSTTDKRGKILSINDVFLDVSGYDKDELIRKPHNIIRHPDMPKVAFQQLWGTLAKGKLWMGAVKNRCKNGDHYWVDAFIAPVFENDEIVGYQSVRSKPSPAIVNRAEHIYGIKSSWRFKLLSKLRNWPLWQRISFSLLLVNAPLIAALNQGVNRVALAAIAGVSMLVIPYFLTKGLRHLALHLDDLVDSAITRQVYGGCDDEVGQVKTALHQKDLLRKTILWRTKESTDEVHDSFERVMDAADHSFEQISSLSGQLEAAASASHQVAKSAQEVSDSADQSMRASTECSQDVNQSKANLGEAVESMHELKAQLRVNMSSIQKLASSADEISQIVDVISSIAEQTNLLALNAAIEAARAGEQGRGFAVVADEVRQLATKTQNSTDDIHAMVQTLQKSSAQVVSSMQDTLEVSERSETLSESASQQLDLVTNCIHKISGVLESVATAAKEQYEASADIDNTIGHINTASSQGLESLETVRAESDSLKRSVNNLTQVVDQFGTYSDQID